MKHKKQRRGGAGNHKVAIALLLVVIMLAAFGATFVMMGGLDSLFGGPVAEPGYRAEGEVRALHLPAPPADADEAGLRDYFTGAADYAVQNSFNTLIFEAKTSLEVWWRDKYFPAPAAVAAQDAGRAQLDPLAILCQVLQGRPVQLWLSIDPYATGPLPAGSKAKVAKLAQGEALAGATTFSPADADYRKLLAESLSRLPRSYSFAGFVFTGFEGEAWAAESSVPDFTVLLEAVHTSLANEGRLVPLGLQYDEADSMMSAAAAVGLVNSGLVRYLLPAIAPGAGLAQRMSAYAGAPGSLVATQPPQDTSGLFLFTAHQSPAWAGVLLGEWPTLASQAQRLAIVTSALTPVDSPLPQPFSIPQVLDITYPVDGRKLTWENVYITGHSNPYAPLLMNGVEVTGRAPNGAFGVFVPLAMGENSFSFQNGDVSAVKVIERIEPTGGGGSPTADGTRRAEKGQAVRVATQWAGVLKDPANDANPNEMFYRGAVAVVEDSRQVVRNGRLTWAYMLKSGDWLPATNCEWISGSGASVITGLSAEAAEGGEWLNFEGGATPGAYVAYDDDTGVLTLTFYDTSLALPEGFSSPYVSAATLEDMGDHVVLSLQTTGIWGYSLEYTEGGMRLFLKKPPVLGQDPARPLEGVHVMLDPGHGQSTEGSNYGAVGIAGEAGYPHEKDINLALAQATAYRLRQLGATVSFTREDELNPSADERLAMQTAQKPDFFISIHHDGLDGNVDLSERDKLLSYYYHPYSVPPSRTLAQNLMATMKTATGRKGEEAGWGYYTVTRTTVCPSILFEYGLIVNPTHYYEATSTEGIYAAAFATAEAILATVPGGAALANPE